MNPGLAAIRRPIDPVTHRKIRTLDTLPACNIDDVRIGRRNSHIPDRAGRLIVKYGVPGPAKICCLPNPAIVDADVKYIRLLWHAASTDGTAPAMRTDHSPA